MSTRLARIVPNDPDSPVVRGVKVIQADGSTIRGIKKITLVAETGNRLWTAKIEMNVLPPVGLTAQYETTDITSDEREFEASATLTKAQDEELYPLYVARTQALAQTMADQTALVMKMLDSIEMDLACRPPHGGRAVTPQDAEAIGKAVAKAMHVPRNNRP